MGDMVRSSPAMAVKKKYTVDDQRRAAYALNMCLVSVSQIIDYDDVMILEQEYEAILNNLNLEHMPKDESLLNILKQLLDTITYFRIAEEEKTRLDRDYQRRMKDAVWKAVPNIGVLVSGGNLLTAAISLVTQVGIGYMNYRKEKARLTDEKDKELWRLQRTAIEQFNGLRRELFDTAWRLSAEYKFSDRFRLTERQIRQYNEILMDTDILRRYQRLDAVKEDFRAYPPFWYYLGHTAREIAVSDNGFGLSGLQLEDLRKEYLEKAKGHFAEYDRENQMPLLREDQIAASSALEYAELLLTECAGKGEQPENYSEQVRGLLKKAEGSSGRANDVLALCAIAYLRIGEETDKIEAARLLRYLVNEDYNVQTNAQMLSALYVDAYCSTNFDQKCNAEREYLLLKTRVSGDYLYPLPPSGAEAEREKSAEMFLNIQKDRVCMEMNQVLEAYQRKKCEEFNKCVPLPKGVFDLSDSKEARENRAKAISNVWTEKDYRTCYCQSKFALGFYQCLNSMCAEIDWLYQKLIPKDVAVPTCKQEYEGSRVKLKTEIEKRKPAMSKLHSFCENAPQSTTFSSTYLEICFSDMTGAFFETVTQCMNVFICVQKDMNGIGETEAVLREFCKRNGISEDVMAVHYEELQLPIPDSDGWNEALLPVSLFGENLEQQEKKNERRGKVQQILSEFVHKDGNRSTWILSNEDGFRGYWGGIPQKQRDVIRSKGWVLAVRRKAKRDFQILDGMDMVIRISTELLNQNYVDLMFTESGIILLRDKAYLSFAKYSDIQHRDGRFKIGEESIKLDAKDDLSALCSLIDKLSEINKT